MNNDEPSPLMVATLLHVRACAEASGHGRACKVCPDDFEQFIDGIGRFCAEGQRIVASIAAAESELRSVVHQPMRAQSWH